MIPLATCMLLAAFQQNPADEYCAYYNLPVHGILRGQALFAFLGGDAKTFVGIGAIPVEKPGSAQLLAFPYGSMCQAHCRHHISGEMLWFFFGPEDVYGHPRGRSEKPLPALKEKYERERGRKFEHHRPPTPAPGVAIDFVPVSDKALRVFFFVMKTKKIETWETEWAFEKWQNARGFNVSGWKVVADERKPETIDSAFVEDFYVFKRKADYYFVTQSGKLYVAAPPKKGEKSRTMKALWEDAKRPIAAVIEDADNDKVWLFTKSQNKLETQAVFFEMAAEVRTEKFDHAKLAPVNVKGRARPLLEYLPLIRDKAEKQPKDGA